MVKSLRKIVSVSLFFVVLLFGGYSCSTDDYLKEYEVRRMIEEALRENNKQLEFTQWKIVNVIVNQGDWVWNDYDAQWQAIADLPELTSDIYETGAALAYVFLTHDDGEVQKLLPYINTYSLQDGTFTETISADFQYGNPSTVGFFIKDSELAHDPSAPQTYIFRIVLIW